MDFRQCKQAIFDYFTEMVIPTNEKLAQSYVDDWEKLFADQAACDDDGSLDEDVKDFLVVLGHIYFDLKKEQKKRDWPKSSSRQYDVWHAIDTELAQDETAAFTTIAKRVVASVIEKPKKGKLRRVDPPPAEDESLSVQLFDSGAAAPKKKGLRREDFVAAAPKKKAKKLTKKDYMKMCDEKDNRYYAKTWKLEKLKQQCAGDDAKFFKPAKAAPVRTQLIKHLEGKQHFTAKLARSSLQKYLPDLMKVDGLLVGGKPTKKMMDAAYVLMLFEK